MNAENLSKVGSRLVKRCGTRDPFSIARQLGIEVLFCENFGPLKGMYRVIKRSRFNFINENLSGGCSGLSVLMRLGMTSCTAIWQKEAQYRSSCYMT